MERLQLVEDLEPEGLDDRRIEEVEQDEQDDDERADQAGRQVETTAVQPSRAVGARPATVRLSARLILFGHQPANQAQG